jgi:UDP-N-acetylglucosamine 2-epimerase (non-hydrolysing)
MRRESIVYVLGSCFDAAMIAPVITELRRRLPRARHALVDMSGVTASGRFRRLFGLPEADYPLAPCAGSPVAQTTSTMERIERVIEVERPDLVMLAGDSTSTLSAALTALKLGIGSANLNSGLRNFDRNVPEEINRVIVDSFADFLFVTNRVAAKNLRREGIDVDRVHFVGSTMADALGGLSPRIEAPQVATRLGLRRGKYLLVALSETKLAMGARLRVILDRLMEISASLPVVFPVAEEIRLAAESYVSWSPLRLVNRLNYVDFLSLEADAAAVLTDSGPVQEEAAQMRVPCFTLRDRTERAATVWHGANRLIGIDPAYLDRILPVLRNRPSRPAQLPLWDGRASARVAEILARSLAARQAPGRTSRDIGVGIR